VPPWTAEEAIDACAGRWNNEFALRPDYLGEAMESGAWSYYADRPILADVWERSRSKPLTRLVARVIDLVAMASGSDEPRLDRGSAETGTGVAVVRTARGLLMHHVRIVDTRVAEYVIVAPTEWNFHEDGAFAQDMRGLVEKDERELRLLAQISALSLDPCVAYEVEIHNA
jgi:coenzyme F420-reducing hydrogenase alpha subunit